MSHKPTHKNPSSSDFQSSIDATLGQGGFAFDADAGQEKYFYQLAAGSSLPNAMVGGEGRDYLWGLGGNDDIAGLGQNDNLFGDGGNDTITGGDGSDRLVGGSGADQLYGGKDADALHGGAGDDFLDEGMGHGDLDGGAGNDVLVGGMGPDAFMVGPERGNDVIKDFTAGPGMFDHLALMGLRWEDLSFADTAQGVRVSWSSGSVLLEGVQKAQLSQDDFMFAESPDLPPAGSSATSPTPQRATPSTEGPAIASGPLPGASFDAYADTTLGGKDPVMFSFADDEKYHVGIGTMKNDRLAGTDMVDLYFGMDRNDRLFGGAGDDILQGDAGRDVLIGEAGRDRLDGGMGDDILLGGGGEDDLMGADGRDNLMAGAGHDMIEGGKGDDRIWGGTGADAFMVRPDSGNDIVFDFEAKGDAQGAFDHLALMEIRPDQVRVQDLNRGALVSWDMNGDGNAEGSVLLLGVFQADLRQSDFMFVEQPGFVAGISTFGSNYIFV